MKNKVILNICLIFLLVACLFVLTGCGNKENEEVVATNNNTTEEVNEEATEVKTSDGESKYSYFNGALMPIVDEEGNPKQKDFVLNGLVLIGNRHQYTSEENGGIFAEGYKTVGINAAFYLNEYIQFYVDTDYSGDVDNVKILVTPHRTIEDYEKMTYAEIKELAEEKGFFLDYKKPDKEDHNYIGENYVNMDLPEGKYDILFTYKNEIAYYMCISMSTEPVEE